MNGCFPSLEDFVASSVTLANVPFNEWFSGTEGNFAVQHVTDDIVRI